MSELSSGRAWRDRAVFSLKIKFLPGVTRKVGLWSRSSQKPLRFLNPCVAHKKTRGTSAGSD